MKEVALNGIFAELSRHSHDVACTSTSSADQQGRYLSSKFQAHNDQDTQDFSLRCRPSSVTPNATYLVADSQAGHLELYDNILEWNERNICTRSWGAYLAKIVKVILSFHRRKHVTEYSHHLPQT